MARRAVANIALQLDVSDDAMTVKLPGTKHSVIYKKKSGSWHVAFDEGAPMPPPDFLTRAWKLAYDKARELGWFPA